MEEVVSPVFHRKVVAPGPVAVNMILSPMQILEELGEIVTVIPVFIVIHLFTVSIHPVTPSVTITVKQYEPVVVGKVTTMEDESPTRTDVINE